MATATMATAARDQGKTSFVKNFLKKNPQGNVKAVNEAWAAAGMKGTIGDTLINKMRSQMGLSGNLRAKSKPRTATTGKAAAKEPKAATTPGKTSFVKEFLNDHPDATAREVNEAWTTAGMKGAVSHTVVSEVRKSLGIVGKPSTKTNKTAPTSKPRVRKPRETISETRASSHEVITPGQESSRTTILLAVETEIDRLIFTVMGLGDLPEIETALRDARRRVCKAVPS